MIKPFHKFRDIFARWGIIGFSLCLLMGFGILIAMKLHQNESPQPIATMAVITPETPANEAKQQDQAPPARSQAAIFQLPPPPAPAPAMASAPAPKPTPKPTPKPPVIPVIPVTPESAPEPKVPPVITPMKVQKPAAKADPTPATALQHTISQADLDALTEFDLSVTSEPSTIKSAAIEPKTTAKPQVKPETLLEQGRPLLRQLEFGDGPAIHIGWPESRHEMQALYRSLTRCYGMKSVILTQDGNYYDAHTEFMPNRDYYSHFMRRPQGNLPDEELRLKAKAITLNGSLVRLFPRSLDAMLLGGLSNHLGADFIEKSITASYHLAAHERVLITDIRVGGNPVNLEIDLGHIQHCKQGG